MVDPVVIDLHGKIGSSRWSYHSQQGSLFNASASVTREDSGEYKLSINNKERTMPAHTLVEQVDEKIYQATLRIAKTRAEQMESPIDNRAELDRQDRGRHVSPEDSE